MKQCGECGFPVRFASLFEWRGDGTILMKQRGGALLQIALLDADELQGLFDSLSETIGFSVDHILVEAQRRVGKAIYANRPIPFLKLVPHSRMTRPQWAIKTAIDVLGRDIRAIGFGVVHVDSYRAGDHLALHVDNACLAPRLAGSFLGAAELVEGVPMTVEYRMDGDRLAIDIRRSEENDRAEERLYLDEVAPARASRDYERCDACGAPVKIARMIDWDSERGSIEDRATGHRDVMFAVQSLNSLQRELEAEIGPRIRNVLYDTQVRLSLKAPVVPIADDDGSFWDDYLLGLALRGMGYPDSFESGEGTVTIEISNAYNQTLYAARIAAALEARTGKSSNIVWHKRDADSAAYSISEAQ
ncbi:MAG TPA: hypothetical protein VIJ97_06350 [Candidatus Anoxymicrobiaceae bacterium]